MVIASFSAFSSDTNTIHSFNSGDTISSSQINSNFQFLTKQFKINEKVINCPEDSITDAIDEGFSNPLQEQVDGPIIFERDESIFNEIREPKYTQPVQQYFPLERPFMYDGDRYPQIINYVSTTANQNFAVDVYSPTQTGTIEAVITESNPMENIGQFFGPTGLNRGY